jgi:GTPase KRas protein
MRTGDGFLCVYSITYAESFKQVQSLHDHILRVKEETKVPFVLVGNKVDLEKDREVPKEKGNELANQIGCKFLECSAKTKVNVTEAFHDLVREIKHWKKERGVVEKKKKKSCTVL